MNDAVRKGRRLTDIDLFDLPSPRLTPYEPEPDWQKRPIVVYSVRRDDDYVIKGKDKYQELGAFLRDIGHLGHKPTDVIDIQPDASIASFHWPRNLSWKSLPLIQAPAYKGGWCPRMVMDDAGMQRGVRTPASPRRDNDDESYIERSPIINPSTRRLVIADYQRNDRTIFEVSAVAGPDVAGVALMHFDGSRLELIDHAEISDIQRRFSAHERFLFNYALNLFVIGGRAWVKAAREQGYSQQLVEYYVPKPGSGSLGWRSAHPLALQVLYALRASGMAVERGKGTIYDLLKSPAKMAAAMPFFRIEDGRFIFEWKGSGRYAPWIEDLGQAEDDLERAWGGVVHILSDLVMADLIGALGDGVALTRLGHRYLELIGDEADDPDVLLRWRTEDGRIGEPEDVPAMDRWLNRTFRAIKRKVNGLSASPPTEAVEHPWPPAPSNVVYVRGYSIALSAEMRADPIIEDLLQEFIRHEAVNDLRRRECGIIRGHLGFGEVGDAEGLWIGIPLGVYDTNKQTLAALDALRDWSTFDERIADLAARFADTVLAPLLASAPSVVEAGRTADEHVVYAEPGVLAEPDPDAPVSLVIKGIVLPIEDLRNETHEMRQLIGLQRLGASVMKITDGIRVTGSGSKVAVSWGLLAGRLNHKTNELVLQTTFNSGRSSGAAAGKAAPLLAMALDDPRLRKDGYWMISPDGGVREIRPE